MAAATPTPADASPASTAPALGCADIADATEVETKRAAVRSCHESRLEPLLRTVLGSRPFALTVEPTIRTSAQVVETSRTSGDVDGTAPDESSTDGSSTTTTEERTRDVPAGDVTALRIAIVIDRAGTTREHLDAVRRLLLPVARSAPDSPSPSVTLARLAATTPATTTTTAGPAGAAGAAATRAQPQPAAATTQSTTSTRPRPSASSPIPTAWIAAALTLVAATAIALAVRRSRQLERERTQLARALAEDERMFDRFASQHPDEVARDLEALFGPPVLQWTGPPHG